jgi:PAS domain S-box-containing protein
MATAPRRLNVGDVLSAGRPLRTPRGKPAVGSAGLDLANELLSRSVVTPEIAEHALERLRHASRAIEVTFWLLTDATAVCVLRAGEHSPDRPLPTIPLFNHSMLGERLRRRGALVCRAGAVTGVEEVVSPAANSYAVLSCINDAGEAGVLAVGWAANEPPCDDTAVAHLQLAAGALLRTLPPLSKAGARAPGDVRVASRIGGPLFQSLIDALPMPIWLHDHGGSVVSANARWTNAVHAAAAHEGRRQWTDLFHPDDQRRAITAFEHALARQTATAFEARVLTPGGAYRLATCDVSPYADADQQVRGYVGCCSDISAQRQAEHALGAMGSRLMAAQEEERGRIARELHDDLGQQTALLAAKMEMLLRSSKVTVSKVDVTSLRKGMSEAKQTVNDLAVSIHNLSHQLHPPKLKLLGLVKTLEALCRNVSKESGVQVSFHAPPAPPGIPERIALCVCRVAQEALQNAVKHSGARHIDLALTADDSELRLRVSDSGRGFDPLASPGAGIGLFSMRERVEMNGGRLSIAASPAGGTTIEAILPIELPY